MSSPKSPAQWSVSVAQDQGNPLIFRVRQNPQLQGLNKMIAVQWTYRPAQQGMPAPADAGAMDALEEKLGALETQGVAVLTAIVTGNGVREWQWYTGDPQGMMGMVNQVLPQDRRLPIQLSMEEDPNHEAFGQLAQLVAQAQG